MIIDYTLYKALIFYFYVFKLLLFYFFKYIILIEFKILKFLALC